MNLNFALTLEEAERRYNLYFENDPFPEIKPSLLNSADIIDYVNTVGMIQPFYKDEINPASYAISALGEYMYWDQSRKKIKGFLKKGEELTLRSDSITFVSLEPMFQLPYYIAARFNFKINNVYRGLLLGAGPLVDPGFVGKLYIPVHNLTTNDYIIRGGETFIWMEFTKINDIHEHKKNPLRGGWYKPFNRKKRNRTLEDYIASSEPQRAIQSSIPFSILKSEKAAKAAKRSTQIITFGTVVGLIGVLGIIFTLSDSLIGLSKDSREDTQRYLNEDSIRTSDLEKTVSSLKKALSIKSRTDSLTMHKLINELDSLKAILILQERNTQATRKE